MKTYKLIIFQMLSGLFTAYSIAGNLPQRSCDLSISPVIMNINSIRNKLRTWNSSITRAMQRSVSASFDWSVDIANGAAANIMNEKSLDYVDLMQDVWKVVPCINCTAANCTDVERRRVESYYNIGTNVLPPDYDSKESPVVAMATIYSSAKVCLPNDSQSCLSLEPDLRNIFDVSRDECKLQWAWEGWHNASGAKIRQRFVEDYLLQEEQAAELNGFDDAKEMWLHAFTYDDENIEQQIEKAWLDVTPLYRQLHGFVRRKLQEYYGEDKFPTGSNHIPAHLLGNMWAQDWTSIFDLVKPFPNAASIDLTALLRGNNFSVYDMVKRADNFFQSLGMDPMPLDFWANSVFQKKPGVDMICQPSAYDMSGQSDFRIKMCSQVTGYDFVTIHHEMGHIQYFMNYKNQPIEFRKGANPGFQEAIGDLIALSAVNPTYLKTIGLLPANFIENKESLINMLMLMALKKVAFLPFGYLIDKYRWAIFDGSIADENLNAEWWNLRCGLQGVSPPTQRTERDFDAGAKYHVAASEEYIMYFYAYLVQFQIHKGLCRRLGFTRNFHQCSIFNSTIAGQVLREVLSLGSSVPYPKILRQLTGTSVLRASALMQYFEPLYQWLQEQNRGHVIHWQEKCPMNSLDRCDYTKLRF